MYDGPKHEEIIKILEKEAEWIDKIAHSIYRNTKDPPNVFHPRRLLCSARTVSAMAQWLKEYCDETVKNDFTLR